MSHVSGWCQWNDRGSDARYGAHGSRGSASWPASGDAGWWSARCSVMSWVDVNGIGALSCSAGSSRRALSHSGGK